MFCSPPMALEHLYSLALLSLGGLLLRKRK